MMQRTARAKNSSMVTSRGLKKILGALAAELTVLPLMDAPNSPALSEGASQSGHLNIPELCITQMANDYTEGS